MTYMPISSFRRSISAAHLAQRQAAHAPLPPQSVNKWDVLRALGTIRHELGLSDRALTVLQALLSFHPGNALAADGSGLIVFPSNASICERLNGMACSTMRRHLAALVAAGLIQRRDSPNGKRFRRRNPVQPEAFGFDLSPLLRRHAGFAADAERVRLADLARLRLRRRASLLRRDLAALCVLGAQNVPQPLWDDLGMLVISAAKTLRRKLAMADLEALVVTLTKAVDDARQALDGSLPDVPRPAPPSPNPSTNDSHSEHHQQSTNKEKIEPAYAVASPPVACSNFRTPAPSLHEVLQTCPSLTAFFGNEITDWHRLTQAAETIRPMLGVSSLVWEDAKKNDGPPARRHRPRCNTRAVLGDSFPGRLHPRIGGQSWGREIRNPAVSAKRRTS